METRQRAASTRRRSRARCLMSSGAARDAASPPATARSPVRARRWSGRRLVCSSFSNAPGQLNQARSPWREILHRKYAKASNHQLEISFGGALSMVMKNRNAILALIVAGSLWGVTVALSKLSLRWLDPSWLSAMRFLGAAPILALFGRRGLREAFTPRVLGSGALGYGVVLLAAERRHRAHERQPRGDHRRGVACGRRAGGRGVGNGSRAPAYLARLRRCADRDHARRQGGGGGATVSGTCSCSLRWSCRAPSSPCSRGC